MSHDEPHEPAPHEPSVAERLAGLLGDEELTVGVSGGGAWSRPFLDVPPALWPRAAELARDALALTFFDWLSAVDELDDGYRVVAHLWSIERRRGLLLRTLVPRDAAHLPTLVPVFPGAAWHERETHEMFGVTFDEHPGGLRKLLLADEFEGNPLRKDFVLASRALKAWPGAKEPGESEGGAASRRRPVLPPGVPAPGEWPRVEGESEVEQPARPRRVRPEGDA